MFVEGWKEGRLFHSRGGAWDVLQERFGDARCSNMVVEVHESEIAATCTAIE